MSGRDRPVEQDALRVLIVVHQLGEESGSWFIDTESQLQHLDHLIRHPIDLTYVLMDQVRSRDTELEDRLSAVASRVRQLLGTPRRGRHRPNLLRPFDPGSWQRWDNLLALLGCRGLLRTEPLPGLLEDTLPVDSVPAEASPAENPGHENRRQLRYRVTSEGARWLEESVYPRQDTLAPVSKRAIETWRERCELLRGIFPAELLKPRRQPGLGAYLRATGRRLDTYRQDEQIQSEDDLLGRLFRSTFAEAL